MKKISKCVVCGKPIVDYRERKTCSLECRHKWESKILAEKWRAQPWRKCKPKTVTRKFRIGPRHNLGTFLDKVLASGS